MQQGFAVLGLLFAISGLVGLCLGAIAVLQGEVVFLLGIGLAACALGLGLLITFKIAQEVGTDNSGLTVAFAFRIATIPWHHILAFRKLFIRMSYRGGEAAVFTLLRFSSSTERRWAILIVRGTGPAFSLAAADYETDLDRHVPEKRIGS